ncbi:MAG: dUTP diphosphatase [Firmicutes bacterium]|nr:dUTP diphosphatase [Alicyclobacillaceae bacterium]MCL6497557.1 dUTP diphosphatase [Bacillota bacterium]
MRRFAVARGYESHPVVLPQRKTRWSAGYDLAAAERRELPPGAVVLVPTGLKALMQPDEVLQIFIRSSLAVHHRVVLANQVGIIDADYAHNPENDGHIWIPLENRGTDPVVIEAGDRIAQAIFTKYLTTEDDAAQASRQGGFGSTGRR